MFYILLLAPDSSSKNKKPCYFPMLEWILKKKLYLTGEKPTRRTKYFIKNAAIQVELHLT
jgi:hypothetical protein